MVKNHVVSIIQKDLFVKRFYSKYEPIGEYFYDFLINLLESVGKETETNDLADVQLWTYVESSYGNQRQFLVSKAVAEMLYDFRCTIDKQLTELGKSHQKIGNNLLMQLNNGDLSMKDFESGLAEKNY